MATIAMQKSTQMGMNGSLKPLLFDFKELPLWNMANVDETIWDLPMMDVVSSCMKP